MRYMFLSASECDLQKTLRSPNSLAEDTSPTMTCVESVVAQMPSVVSVQLEAAFAASDCVATPTT